MKENIRKSFFVCMKIEIRWKYDGSNAMPENFGQSLRHSITMGAWGKAPLL